MVHYFESRMTTFLVWVNGQSELMSNEAVSTDKTMQRLDAQML